MMSADSNVSSEWGSTEEEIVAIESSKDRDTPLDCNNGDIINSSPLL